MLKLLSVLFIASFVASQGIVDPRCPITIVIPSVRLPHDTDCSRFYICQLGLKHLMPACPKGLLYDAPTSACVDEKIAKCEQVIVSSTTGSPTVPTAKPVTSPPVTSPPVTVPTAKPVTPPTVAATPARTVPSVTGTTKFILPTVPQKP